MVVVHWNNAGDNPLINREQNIDAWTKFFRQCWRKALDYSKFTEQAKSVFADAPLNGADLFKAWSNQIEVQRAVTARMLCYLDILQELMLIREVTVLDVIYEHLPSTFAKGAIVEAGASDMADIGALARMTANTLLKIQGKAGKRPAPDVQISMHLFQLIGSFAGTALARGGMISGTALTLGEAIANFLIAHINDLHATGVLVMNGGRAPSPLKRAFSKVIPSFIDVLTSSGSQLAASLSLLQQQSRLQEGMDDQVDEIMADGDTMSFTQAIQVDSHNAPARASLYAYLTAALTATPRLDDDSLQVFLQARYHDDVQAMAIDLITASFDVLSGAMERREHMEVIIIHKSFITNKVPSILEQLTQQASLNEDSDFMGQCVTAAIKRVHESYQGTTVFQPGSDACPKQRFLLSCALYGFIQLSAVPTLLGYPPTQGLPSSGRYDKTRLVQECQADSKRMEQLVGELNLMEGNAAAIARALLEVLHILCTNRDTMTLKMLCVAFLRKSHHINVMLLFANPRHLLQPLCNLLDQWQAHDDQGEQLIVYDEFGSILLFVLMCQYRYDLPLSSFTTASPDSFITGFFRDSTLAKHAKEIEEAERKNLTGWVKGLFEGNGVSDELLSSCPPKDFYKLAATLTDQIMTATQTGVLGLETANAGAEYLLEPFLLPALVIVFALFATRLSSIPADSPQIDCLMPILWRLVKPPKLSPDAAPLHQAVLFISARSLWQTLIMIKSVQKNRKDVGPMIESVRNDRLKPFSLGAARPLLEEWCTDKKQDYTKSNNAGLATTFQSSLDNLNKWNSPGKAVPDRQAYNHRLTVFAINMLGATRSLDLLLDQASKAATNPKATDQILDTLTGLIAASSLTATDARMSLRDALTHAFNESQNISTSRESAARISFTTRLYRRVEEHCAKPMSQPPTIIPLNVDLAMSGTASQPGVGLGVDIGALDAETVAAVANVDMKDIPMQDTRDLMAGLETAAKGAPSIESAVAQQQQQEQQQEQEQQQTQATIQPDLSADGDLLNLGDMGDMADMGQFEDFLQDLDVSGTQNFDDIFDQM